MPFIIPKIKNIDPNFAQNIQIVLKRSGQGTDWPKSEGQVYCFLAQRAKWNNM